MSSSTIFLIELSILIRRKGKVDNLDLPNYIAVTVNAERNASNPEELNVKWSDFPSDFVFGVSTAAAQVH